MNLNMSKSWIFGILFTLAMAGNVWLGVSIWQTKIELSYYEGIRNVTRFMDCFGYRPYAADLVALRNTNIQNCQDISLLVNHREPVNDGEIASE